MTYLHPLLVTWLSELVQHENIEVPFLLWWGNCQLALMPCARLQHSRSASLLEYFGQLQLVLKAWTIVIGVGAAPEEREKVIID